MVHCSVSYWLSEYCHRTTQQCFAVIRLKKTKKNPKYSCLHSLYHVYLWNNCSKKKVCIEKAWWDVECSNLVSVTEKEMVTGSMFLYCHKTVPALKFNSRNCKILMVNVRVWCQFHWIREHLLLFCIHCFGHYSCIGKCIVEVAEITFYQLTVSSVDLNASQSQCVFSAHFVPPTGNGIPSIVLRTYMLSSIEWKMCYASAIT